MNMVSILSLLCFHLTFVYSLHHNGETQPFAVSKITDLLVDEKELSPEHLHNAGPNVVHVQFKAFNGHHFFMNLTLYEHNVHPEAPDDLKRYWEYTGEAWINHWLPGTASLQFHAEHTKSYFTGMIVIDGIQYRIQPAHRYDDDDLPHNSGMAISRLGHFDDEKVAKPIDFDHKKKDVIRRRLQIEKFTNCWPDQGKKTLVIKVGYMIDNSFKLKVNKETIKDQGTFKERILRYVRQVNLDSNTIYHPQFDVHISIAKVLDGDSRAAPILPAAGNLGPSTAADNLDTIYRADADKSSVLDRNVFNLDGIDKFRGCHDNSINAYLTRLINWRRGTGGAAFKEFGLLKLLTNCHEPGGTVGLASVGATCSGGGAGVSNHMTPRYGGTWKVNAHEAGHIFGAGHSFDVGGGIMDYGDGKVNGVFQFNQVQKGAVCGRIQQTLERDKTNNNFTPNCWAVMGQNGERYKWVKSANGFANVPCKPSHGKWRYKYVPYFCETYQASGATSIDATGNACLGTPKPFATQYLGDASGTTCPNVAATSTPNNGIIEGDEECEVALLTKYKAQADVVKCCDTSTSKWKEYQPAAEEPNTQNSTNPGCVGSNNRVDASFRKEDGTVYLFQDKKVYRFSPPTGDSILTEDAGWPRLILSAFPGLPANDFRDGIEAAAHQPGSNMVYFWKKNQSRKKDYIKYDLGNMQAVGGMQELNDNIDDYTIGGSGAEQAKNWGECREGVTAAFGTPSEVWLFCSNQVLIIDWEFKHATKFGAQTELPYNFPDAEIKSHPSAAYFKGGASTHARMFNRGFYIDWWLNSELNGGFPNAKLVPGLGLAEADEELGRSDRGVPITRTNCADGCASCELTDTSFCVSCDKGKKIFAKSSCVDEEVQIKYGFEENAPESNLQLLNGAADYENFLKFGRLVTGAGSVGNPKGLRFTNPPLGSDPEGWNGNTLKFAKLRKKFLTMDVTIWFKPKGAHSDVEQRLFTFRSGNNMKMAVNIVSFNSMTATTGAPTQSDPSGKGQLVIIFPRGQGNIVNVADRKTTYRVPCTSNTAIAPDQWNEIRVAFDRSTLQCCINSDCVKRAYAQTATNAPYDIVSQTSPSAFTVDALDFTVDDFEVGSGTSIEGDIDNIEVRLSHSVTEKSPKLLIYIIGCALIVFTVGYLVYKKQVDCCNPCGAEGHSRSGGGPQSVQMQGKRTGPSSNYSPPKQPPKQPVIQPVVPPKRGGPPPPKRGGPPPKKAGSYKFGNNNKFAARAPPPPPSKRW